MVHRVLALVVLLFSLESFFDRLSVISAVPDKIIFWQQWRWAAASLLPGSLLTFALMFGQGDPWAPVRKWKWGILAAFTVYPVLLTPVFAPFFRGHLTGIPSGGRFLSLGGSGHAFMILFILGLVPVMALLERTLRASKGIYRWQVKFLVLGIVSYLAARLFTSSMSILFRHVDLGLDVLNSGALIIAGALMTGSFLRTRVLPSQIYVSPRMIRSSITVTLVGLYLMAMGITAKVVVSTGSRLPMEVLSFLVFLSFLGLSIVLLSDRLRQSIKRFVSRDLTRPMYDYRHVWESFTRRTSALMDTRGLCAEAARLISETLEVLSVNILLADDSGRGWSLAGSTAHEDPSNANLDHVREALDEVSRSIAGGSGMVDIQKPSPERSLSLSEAQVRSFKELRMRYFIPLTTGGDPPGLLALDEKVGYTDLTTEEEDLLRTIVVHLAGSIEKIALSDQLREAREMETLQTFSAFFVHDLKNLSSKLSFTLQNLPEHFDNPEFRKDTLRLISQSVGKINSMTGRMSLLREKIQLEPAKTDLNQLVRTTLADLAGVVKSPIAAEYCPLPETLMDAEQIGKVLTNLILNAHEADENGKEIRIRTEMLDEWLVISVRDHGRGMSREFMQTALFRPFSTTKKRGLGIGLYHCKAIVEAHRGRIEVESREGNGSTFRVFLPGGVKHDG